MSDRKQRTILNRQCSTWGDVTAGVPLGSILGPLLFLVYIYDLTVDLRCDVKLFADDTSLFTIVENASDAAIDLSHDFDLIKQWALQWRMSVNPDPQKQAVEMLFSRKHIAIDDPEIRFNNIPVMKVSEHKHLGVILDSKLSFSLHINAAISKARSGIGGLRLLSRYLPRSSLCEICKLHIHPHLDYGDVLYHIPTKVYEFRSTNTSPSIMEKIESVQYSADLAVTGAWKGTSRDRLYEELSWESLDSRRWTRRLTLFYKIVNKLTPAYMLHPIPPLQQAQYSLRRGEGDWADMSKDGKI